MTLCQQMILIAAVVLGTMLTRFVPFLCFPAGKPLAPYVQFLGRNLPLAVFGLLVVYCLKDVSFASGSYGLPEAAGIAVTVVIHLLFRKMLCSMAAGTLCYILLLNFVNF